MKEGIFFDAHDGAETTMEIQVVRTVLTDDEREWGWTGLADSSTRTYSKERTYYMNRNLVPLLILRFT